MVLKKIHNEIEAEYSKRQMMAKQNAEQRKSFIYETLPEIMSNFFLTLKKIFIIIIFNFTILYWFCHISK